MGERPGGYQPAGHSGPLPTPRDPGPADHPGPGRPSTGVRVDVRIPADQLATIDAAATAEGTTRAEIIRAILTNGLTGKGWLGTRDGLAPKGHNERTP